jgi:hypothetical protein
MRTYIDTIGMNKHFFYLSQLSQSIMKYAGDLKQVITFKNPIELD